MTNVQKYAVKLAVFDNGERYPLLLDELGIPLWQPTLFLTTQVRNASKMPNTMVAVLSAIRILLLWAQSHEIELESRLSRCLFLNNQEIESLCRYTQTQILATQIDKSKVISFATRQEDVRAATVSPEPRVKSTTQYIRMSYIADYLEWLSINLIEHRVAQVSIDVLSRIKRMVGAIRMRRPFKARASVVFARKGLTKKEQDSLLSLIEIGTHENPFSMELQRRNQLIILLLYYLGLRTGELLALRVSDFDLQQNTVLIARRHDNIHDPRAHQPVVKTADRLIPLSESLAKLVTDYILKDRAFIAGAKRHDFLFITHKLGKFRGKPLSMKGLTKVFIKLQIPEYGLEALTPHVLRHTANDMFSELMDNKSASSSEEEKLRSYLMGWKEGSGSATAYTRRHIEKKAREAALKLQGKER